MYSNVFSNIEIKAFFLLFFGWQFFGLHLCADSIPEDYFQQEVDYTIHVTLDDEAHRLTGNIAVTYRNNAREPLTEIYMHVWPNAFSGRQTAFADQMLQHGNTSFHFADKNAKGNISGLDFKVDGVSVAFENWDGHADVLILKLQSPLEPGTSIIIETPFIVQIPESFSRLGRVGQSYQLTQWYPKPAVYDHNGWNPMPYLSFGEYYSSFGRFDVYITLPANYVVGATGICTTPEEQVFMQQRIDETALFLTDSLTVRNLSGKHPFPESDTILKTIHFEAAQVHDFAWFADKRFYVESADFKLPNGDSITAYTMFTNEEVHLWHKHALNYVIRSTIFYSELVGNYPYPQVTALQSALSAGAGMEYPMVTVIGLMGSAKLLDIVIAHEVGHNWFYGILATNERAYPWLDEGMNSYIERLYTEAYYGKPQVVQEFIPFANVVIGGEDQFVDQLSYQVIAGMNLHQPPATHSEAFSYVNYGVCCYMMPAHFFSYLQAYLGKEVLLDAFREYYTLWQFKHPQPEDVRAVFERVADKDLSWFFDDLIGSTRYMDYFISKARQNKEGIWEIEVRNRGSVPGPFTISALSNNEILKTEWFEGFTGSETFDMGRGTYDEFVIDVDRVSADLRPGNNTFVKRPFFPRAKPLKIQMVGLVNQVERTQLNVLPIPGYNTSNGFMLGGLFHNYRIPSPGVQFYTMPLFSFKTLSLNGSGRIQMNLQPENGIIRRAAPYLSAKSYHETGLNDQPLRYLRLEHGWKVDFKRRDYSSPHEHSAGINLLWVLNEILSPPGENGLIGTYNHRRALRMNYKYRNNSHLDPYSINITMVGEPSFTPGIQDISGYLRFGIEYNQSFLLNKHGHRIRARIYGGGFALNSDPDFGAYPLGLSSNAGFDYFYDATFMDRSNGNSILARQVMNEMGGFKVPLSGSQVLGSSNAAILALNLESDIPIRPLGRLFPIKPYADIGYFVNTFPFQRDEPGVWINAGLKLDFYVLDIYFPLWSNEKLKNDVYNNLTSAYSKRITFAFRLDRITQLNYVRQYL